MYEVRQTGTTSRISSGEGVWGEPLHAQLARARSREIERHLGAPALDLAGSTLNGRDRTSASRHNLGRVIGPSYPR